MLEVQMGINRDARRERLIKKIIEACDAGVENMYLLVPEQATHIMTREICLQIGERASRHIEVIGFEQLISRVYDQCGGRKVRLDDGGRLMTMALAVRKVREKTTVFHDAENKPEILKSLLQTGDTLSLHGIPHEELATAALKVESTPLREKLNDLNTIYDSYFELCGDSVDKNMEYESVAQIITNSNVMSGTTWFVDGFSELPKVQLEIVLSIARQSNYMLVSLPCSGIDDDRISTKTTVETLKQIYKADKLEISATRTSDESGEHAALGLLQRELCETTIPAEHEIRGAEKVVKLFADPTPYEECQHIAGTILRAIRKGYRYRDISIVLADYERYEPVLEAVCGRYDIPVYFSSKKDEIARKPIMLAINGALDSVTRGMSKEDVLKYLKSGMTNLVMEEVDALESYVLPWNIHGRGWTPAEGGWTMHPGGYGKDFTEEDEKTLEAINQCREKAIAPLQRLQESFSHGHTNADYLQALYDFLVEIQFTERLQDIVDSLMERGQEQTAMEYAQVAEVLNNAMEQMHLTLGGEAGTPQTFTNMFKSICRSYKISTIPATMDQVNVFSVPDARFICSKIRYIAGAEEGIFPSYEQESSILTECDICELTSNGVDIPIGENEWVDRKMSDIFNTISGAKKMLVFSYATGNDATPSHLLLRTQKLLPTLVFESGAGEKRIYDADLLSPEMAGRLLGRISKKERYSNIMESLAMVENETLQEAAMRVLDKASWALGDLTSKSVKGLYGEKISLSATRADTYSACRYHYFLKYGLALQEPPRGVFNSPVFGSFAHAVLEGSVKEIESAGGFSCVTDKQVEAIARNHIAKYTETKMRSLEGQPERYTYLYRRNCREILNVLNNICCEFRKSDFHPASFELKMGGESADLPPIHIPGEKMDGQYTGVIDRVDTCVVNGKPYFRICDYKTGSAKSIDMSDILAGMSMQLLMYQASLKKVFGDKSSAGVLYMPAKNGLVAAQVKLPEDKVKKEHQKMMTRHGMLLNDIAVLNAMEHIEEGVAEFLPVKFGADGKITGDVCSAEQIDQLDIYTQAKMSEIVGGIAGGEVKANPISRGMDRTACTYCPMKNACHKDSCGVKYRYRAQVTSDQFWSAIAERARV